MAARGLGLKARLQRGEVGGQGAVEGGEVVGGSAPKHLQARCGLVGGAALKPLEQLRGWFGLVWDYFEGGAWRGTGL